MTKFGCFIDATIKRPFINYVHLALKLYFQSFTSFQEPSFQYHIMGITFRLLVFDSYSLMPKLNTLSNSKKLCFLSMGVNRLHHNTYTHTEKEGKSYQLFYIL